MDEPGWSALALDPQLSQGDLIDEVPFPFFRKPLKHLKKIQVKNHPEVWEPVPKPSLSQQDQTYYALSGCAIVPGLVISHGCAIDKPDPRVLVAPVLSMSTLQPDTQEIVKRQQHRAFVPLLGMSQIDDSYCDPRRITPIDREFLAKRILSMTETGRDRLHAHLVAFLIEREMPTGAFGAAR